MTTTTTTPIAERDRIRSAVVSTGIATAVVSSICTYLGAHNWQEYTMMIALAVVVGAVVYGRVLPRALDRAAAPGTAMTLSAIAALVLLPAFWSGLPLVLGAAGALLGYAGRRAAAGSGVSIAALVLGVLSVIGYLSIYVTELATGVI